MRRLFVRQESVRSDPACGSRQPSHFTAAEPAHKSGAAGSGERAWRENPREVFRGTRCSRSSLSIGTLTVLAKYVGGQYESSCSRGGHFGAFSGCRIGSGAKPASVSPLRVRTPWPRLRLRVPSSLLRLLSSPPPSSPLVSLLKTAWRHG
jgi:hypothetical protein